MLKKYPERFVLVAYSIINTLSQQTNALHRNVRNHINSHLLLLNPILLKIVQLLFFSHQSNRTQFFLNLF